MQNKKLCYHCKQEVETIPLMNAFVYCENEDCPHDYDNPIRKGRAHFVCRKCGEDISLTVILLYEAEQNENT